MLKHCGKNHSAIDEEPKNKSSLTLLVRIYLDYVKCKTPCFRHRLVGHRLAPPSAERVISRLILFVLFGGTMKGAVSGRNGNRSRN